jgi:hypothetical protein
MSANEAKFAGQSSFSATSSSNGAAKSNLFSLPSSKKRPGEFLVDDRGRAIRPAPSEQPFNPFEQMERAEEDDQRARDTREIIRAHASHGNGGVAGGWAPGRVSSNGSNGYGASNGNGDGYNSGGGGGGRGGYDDDDRYNKRARSNGYDDRPASLNGVGRGEVFGREDGSRVYREVRFLLLSSFTPILVLIPFPPTGLLQRRSRSPTKRFGSAVLQPWTERSSAKEHQRRWLQQLQQPAFSFPRPPR